LTTLVPARYPLFVAIGGAVMAGVLVGLMLTVVVAPPGVAEPGTVVTVGLPLTRALLDLAAATTVGVSLLPELLGADRPNRAAPVQSLARTVAIASSAILGLAALASLVLETADLDVGQPLSVAAIDDHVQHIASGRALLYVAGAAFGYLVITLLAVPTELRIAVALLALLPLPATGHADSGTSWRDVDIVSTELHVVAATVWTGGLLAVILLIGADRTLLSFALPRYSRIATVCVFVTAFTGMASGWLELYQTPGVHWYVALLTSGYGQLLLLKVVCLTGAALLGAHTRFKLLPRIIHGRATALIALATAELAFMGLAFGLASVLVRAPVA